MVLLGEAMLAIALSRNWQLSWWSWHVLMLVSFLATLGTRSEYRRSGSLTGAFGGLYLEATLARIDRWHARAIAAVAAAGDRPEAADRVLDELRREGASSDEIALVAEAAGEVKRLDRCSGRTSPHTWRARCGRSRASGASVALNAR